MEKRQVVLYHHTEPRGHEAPLKFFSGYLNCDGWGAYHLLPDVDGLYAVVTHGSIKLQIKRQPIV